MTKRSAAAALRAGCSFVVLISALLFAVDADAQQLRIITFAVGQTDAQLVIGPEKTLLIDAGAEVSGPKKQYEYSAQRIEELTGGRTIDYFLITHYHMDHMGNLYPNSTKGNGLWGLLDQENVVIRTIIDRGDESPFSDQTNSHTNR